MFQNVLVPTDGSAPASRAVEQAIELAAEFDATLHALFVADVDEQPLGDLSESHSATSISEYGTALTNGIAERTPDDLEVVPTVKEGDPREEIITYASVTGIDCIVMGTQGHSGIDRLLLGSVSEFVVRNADCSVLVTRPEEDEEPVTSADEAIEVARTELEESTALDAPTDTLEIDDPHEMGGYWIVHAETDERAFNVHISRATGTVQIADISDR